LVLQLDLAKVLDLVHLLALQLALHLVLEKVLVLAVEDRQVLQTLGVVLMEEGPEQIVLMP
jgi:hypothetical protein